jgi:glyoxylate carboligase
LLLRYLEMLDVEYVFGVPGGAIEPLYNALARSQRRGGIRPIVARHEAGAAFMAFDKVNIDEANIRMYHPPDWKLIEAERDAALEHFPGAAE